jgi:integrase/recombinase XerD
MSKLHYQNEKMKRMYFERLQEAKGYSKATILAIEKAIWKYEEFTKKEDYRSFNSEKAKAFKRWLATKKNERSKKPVSLSYQYHTLRHLKMFLEWLRNNVGYKSKLHQDDIDYLQLSKADSRIATTPKLPKYPSLPHIIKLTQFEIKNEIDMRDRALIAFAALSAMRDTAIITLPLGCFDVKELTVDQNPAMGVKTKFSKRILTKLFVFDKRLLKYITDWHKYLTEEKLFVISDPLFPASKIELQSKTEHVFTVTGVEKAYWKNTGPMRNIFKLRASHSALDYYSPHKFRHFAISEASKHANTTDQLKAISQNIGHENISTTFYSYGGMDPYRVSEVIGKMDFLPGE